MNDLTSPAAGFGAMITICSSELREAFDKWNALRGDRFAPSRHDFQPEDFRPWWSQMILVDVISDGDVLSFDYRYVGRLLERTAYNAPGGPAVREDISHHIDVSQKAVYSWVVRRRRPQRQFMSLRTSAYPNAFFERIVLPLSSEGSVVDKLMAVSIYENWPVELAPGTSYL